MQGLALHKGNLDYKWILLGVDIFTRRAYAEKSKTKDGPAIASAMKRLLDSGMKAIEGSSDFGNEFNNPEMRKLLDDRRIAWRFKDPEDLNASVLSITSGDSLGRPAQNSSGREFI